MKKYIFNWLTAAIIFLVLVAALVLQGWFSPEQEGGGQQVTEVRRDSFRVFVSARGLVRPADVYPIKSEISSNLAKIIWLIKEGAAVKKGDVVARFDTKPFQDELFRADRDVGDAEATLEAAKKVLLMQKEEEEGRIEEAQRKVEIAGIDAENIKNGSGPLERKQVEQRLKKAERGYRLARLNFDDMEVLLKKGHASLRERDKAADELETAKETLGVAKEELSNFDTYKWPKMIREAELLVNGAESELQRVTVTAELQLQNKSSEVEKARRNLVNRKAVQKKARSDLENCDVKAPTDGIVLYAELPRETGRRKIQIGDSVWVGQTFLEVPDTSELVVEVQIREIDVAKIKEGMKVEVLLDALPGKTFGGEVDTVASLAAKSSKDNNIRRFYARVKLQANDPDIHVGMSATTNILYYAIEDALLIPVSAVQYKSGSTFVNRMEGDKRVLTEIELGGRGASEVQVLSGLNQGDQVVYHAN